MPIYVLDDLVPTISPSAWIAPDAVVIGDVRIGDEASIWPGAVLRGDHGHVVVGERTSIQDGTVVHTTEQWPTVVGAGCVVGHNVHLEGCLVEPGCLVGSGSVVLNRARIGTGSVVGACALVPEDLAVPAGSLAVGVPARVRPLSGPEQGEWIGFAVETYVATSKRYRSGLRLYDPRRDGPRSDAVSR